ncbi:hypothetical protein J1605_022993 [Eschrichtius robustus]|uniref:Nipped-B protein n=1 Tax=Eschrichtius robustus TaxID=9764 RepID=A0AB34H6L1_ESCRO|nr:hypothetical protein J1605_022993 [Eschrichtius robustus]
MKLGKDEKDQSEKAAMYDIISSPSKDSTKLTLRLSRVRSSDMDQQEDMLSGMENSNVSENDIPFNVQYPGQTSKTPITPQDVNRPLNAAQCLSQQEQTAFLPANQVPVLQQNTSVATKQPQTSVVQNQQQVSQQGPIYDEVELDALAEIERIERESAIERERFSKEVQDKDKPLKKRKQDSYPQEAGGATGGNRPASQETGSTGNGSRPALMVSIDLHQAGRVDSQASVTQDSDSIKKPEEIKQCNDAPISVLQEDIIGNLKSTPENHPETPKKKSDPELLKSEVKQNESRLAESKPNENRLVETKSSESKIETKIEVQTEEPKQNESRMTESRQNESTTAEPKQNENRVSDTKLNDNKQNNGRSETTKSRPETPKQKGESRPETPKQKSDGHPETPKQKGDGRPETPKQKGEGRPETPKQKNEGRPETPKHRHENRRDSGKPTTEKKPEVSKHKQDIKSDSPRLKSERAEALKQRPDGRSISESLRRDHDSKQKSDDRSESERHRGDQSRVRRPETLRSSSRNEHGIKSDVSKPDKIERKHRHESGDSRERPSSGEQKARPDSPRVKQGDSNKSRPDKPGFKSPNSKDDKRTEGNKSKVDSNKTHPDNKAEFPSYLLGGRSGALKNFVIPKIKRDKDGNITQETKKMEMKGEQKDKVEKMGLVEDLNKGAKPVVVLQKLSLDDVQKLIKDREDKSRSSLKPTKNKPSKSNKGSIDQSVLKELPPELLAEIESTMPLCERVKMNKRKRSTVNEKPKYAEISSDEDNDSDEAFEFARKMKKKEKQKKRKAYEPKLTPEGDDDEIPQELLLGKHQLNELGSESAKIKAMGIMDKNNDTEEEERLWRDLIMERVTKSADACLTTINIMTSPNMPKAVYIEDVIERVIQYTKFHLQNTLYPQYDPVYRLDPHGGGLLSSKAKRAKCSTHKQRVIVMLYNKVCDIVSSLSELLEIQLLTDTTILQVSSMGITPFFVENVSELQLCAIKLVTAVFSRYEKHRQLILEEIFTSLARLPTSKRSLRNFRLNSSDMDGEPMYIQMVTALVLQLIQCVVHLPSSEKDSNSEEDSNKKVDQDVVITNSYETAMRTAQNFLSIFLKKCGSKQGEEDYRPLFENFVQDLLSTVNKPEWPAAELLLSLLGRLLVHQFSNKSTEMALRVASLDYLGTVAARLRKDAVTSKMDQGSIERILKQVSGGEDEIQQLQKALLDYLDENTETDPSLVFSRKFYIAQWFRDTTLETEKAMKSQKDEESSEGTHHAKEVETTGQIMHRAENRKKFLRSIIKTTPSQFSTLKMNSDTVDYDDACLIVRYLASMRPFAQSFDIYLTQILRVLGENAIAVRTKAMKCLSEVVAVDPSILARLDMQRGVHGRLMDNSTSVREAAVELLGRFVLCRPQLAEQYYDMLIERILDTGISVRKRVIKILRDICIEQPTFPKITEMCVKMIRRVNDEEGIKVAACRDTGYDWFEQLLQNTQNDFMVICNVAKILELVVPLMEHPSETFLATIEEDLMKLIIKYGMTVNIKDKVLELLMYFTKHSDEEVQTKAIIGLGFAFIQHPSLMFEQEVKNLYNNILSDKNSSVNLKIQVLKNLQTYLQEEDTRMQQADRDWKKVAKQEDLKEMGDVSSGMSSSIMQLYLKQVLEAFFHTQSSVRHFALNVIALTLNQGLIHPVQSMVKDKRKERKSSPGKENESSESEEEVSRPRKSRKRVDSDSDSDSEDDINSVMKCLPENSAPLIEFANVSQGILLLLMLKQHLKNLCGFSDSKIQKYSPSESAKVYDKAINRKTGVHFHPKQTLDFLRSDMANSKITEDVKRSIVKQYLDFKLLMEHLDPDEEEEEGEVSASTNARNKAITSLLGGGSPKNNAAAETEDDESDGEDRGGGTSGSLRRSKRNSDSTELAAQMNESVDVMDVIAICCPKYKDRPQIARVVQKTSNGFSVQWMAGSYSGSWTEAKRRDGRKLVPWVDTIKESDIIYKKIALTSANKLTNKVVQTLRSLYAAKDGTSS